MKLYTIVEAVPSRILGLASVLHATAGDRRGKDELVSLLQPPALRKGADAEANMATKVIEAARELGVVEDCETDRGEPAIRLTEPATALTDAGQRHRWVAKRVLHDLVEAESQHFAMVVAWLMTLRAKDVPQDRAGWKTLLKGDGFDLAELQLSSDARWDNLFDWLRFVGVIWQTRSARETPGVVRTPSVLLGRFLDELLPDEEELSASEFRNRIGALFPSLDGGRVFREVKRRVAAVRSEVEADDRWSPGVTSALHELKERGQIDFYCPNDQRTFLLLDDGEPIAFVRRRREGVR